MYTSFTYEQIKDNPEDVIDVTETFVDHPEDIIDITEADVPEDVTQTDDAYQVVPRLILD